MKQRHLIFSLSASAFLLPTAFGLEILFRYDLDTENFFDQPGAREALEAAGQFYEDLIVDELEEIDPNNFQDGPQRAWRPLYLEPNEGDAEFRAIDATNLVVPRNTLIIFAGGRKLETVGQGGPGGIEFLSPASLDWINQLINRGEPGATTFQNNTFSSGATDFAPWGGTIFFDSDRSWNFSTSDASANSGFDFLPVALHEIGHVLGIGNIGPTSSWLPLVSNLQFQGPLARFSNQNNSPALDGFPHWAADLPPSHTLAAFGRTHGERQAPLMQSIVAITNASEFLVPTDLDQAALRDIGWELVATPTPLEVELTFRSKAPSVAIPTVTGINYQIWRSTSLENPSALGAVISGDGSIQTWLDPEGLSARAFYQVEALTTPSNRSRNTKKRSPQAENQKAEVNLEVLPTLPASQCSCGR